MRSEVDRDEFGRLQLLGVDGLSTVAQVISDDFLHFIFNYNTNHLGEAH